MALPTRSLLDPIKPARYVPSHQTNIRRTFRKARLLQRLLQNKLDAPNV
jgi:hypothetical protein